MVDRCVCNNNSQSVLTGTKIIGYVGRVGRTPNSSRSPAVYVYDCRFSYRPFQQSLHTVGTRILRALDGLPLAKIQTNASSLIEEPGVEHEGFLVLGSAGIKL